MVLIITTINILTMLYYAFVLTAITSPVHCKL